MYRTYNVRTGSWGSIDPILHPGQGAYVGLDGTPNLLIDPLGLETPSNPLTPNPKPFREFAPRHYTGSPTILNTQEGTQFVEKMNSELGVVGQASTFERNGIIYGSQVDDKGRGVYYTAVPSELANDPDNPPELWIISPELAKEVFYSEDKSAEVAGSMRMTYESNGKISKWSKATITGDLSYGVEEVKEEWSKSIRDPFFWLAWGGVYLSRIQTTIISTKIGNTDIKPTLNRIEVGNKFPHIRDGSIFHNREGLLPQQPTGYYQEYVHPTPGVKGPGKMRIVIGKDGDIWFTEDHYESFVRIK